MFDLAFDLFLIACAILMSFEICFKVVTTLAFCPLTMMKKDEG
jgi:hypothetical protein